MPDSDAPQENDPWADLPTPEQAALTPPPLPTVEIRPPVIDTTPAPPLPPDAAASQDTVSIDMPSGPPEPPPTVFTGPPTGLADPTVAVPPIVSAPDFVAEAPAEPEEADGSATGEPDAPLVDRTGRDTGAVVWAGLGILVWVGALAGAWWALTRSPNPVVAEVDLPSPKVTFDALSDMIGQNEFWDHILHTAARLVGAIVVGGVVGLGFGRVIGGSPRFGRLLQPIPALFRFAAPAVFFPILLVWWGLDVPLFIPPAIAVFASVSFTTAGAFADAGRGWTFAVGARVVEGIRSALPLAWATLALVEVVGSATGVVSAIWTARTFLRMDQMLVWLGVAILLTLVLDLLLRLVQHLLRPGRRDDVPPVLR